MRTVGQVQGLRRPLHLADQPSGHRPVRVQPALLHRRKETAQQVCRPLARGHAGRFPPSTSASLTRLRSVSGLTPSAAARHGSRRPGAARSLAGATGPSGPRAPGSRLLAWCCRGSTLSRVRSLHQTRAVQSPSWTAFPTSGPTSAGQSSGAWTAAGCRCSEGSCGPPSQIRVPVSRRTDTTASAHASSSAMFLGCADRLPRGVA